jgi:hypothetical protein
MKFRQILGEEMSYKNDGKYLFRFIENPSPRELDYFEKKVSKTIKIIVTDKSFYVFPDDVNFKAIKEDTPDSLHLNGKIENGKVIITSFDTYFYNLSTSNKTLKTKIENIDKWRWADKYSNLSHFLKSQV